MTGAIDSLIVIVCILLAALYRDLLEHITCDDFVLFVSFSLKVKMSENVCCKDQLKERD